MFVTQNTVLENEVTYSQINITDNAIPIWGFCHRRLDNDNVVLMINSGIEETNCFRCFNLRLVAKNVVRVRTTDADYISKCYTNEERAICPTEADLQDPRRHTEVILYSEYPVQLTDMYDRVVNDTRVTSNCYNNSPSNKNMFLFFTFPILPQKPKTLKAAPSSGNTVRLRAASRWSTT